MRQGRWSWIATAFVVNLQRLGSLRRRVGEGEIRLLFLSHVEAQRCMKAVEQPAQLGKVVLLGTARRQLVENAPE